MCAIIGVVGSHIPEYKRFLAARDTMFHRGPDDGGEYYNEKDGVALGHRRLSIIDLSAAGHQPLESHDGRFIITFNGEIYNYQEIRKELEDDYPFETQTDTEVLIAAYAVWGDACLQKLNGMFAFALWDTKEHILFAARDRLGVKPFFYYIDNGVLYFASEVKAILASTNIERKLNPQGFLDFLNYRYPLGGGTLFKNIFSLLPGHYMVFREGSNMPTFKEYWELPVIKEEDKVDPGEDIVIKETTKLLNQSIAYRMISDVPTGAYLSGGLDSSLIVALMARQSSKPINTFSVGFKEDGFNEFEFSRQVAEEYATNHHEVVLSVSEYLDATQDVIRFKDAPVAVPFEVSGYLLSKELKKYITVILAGEGSDELFGGYGRIFRSGDDFIAMRKLQDETYLLGNKREALKKNLIKKYGRLDFATAQEFFLFQYPYFTGKDREAIIHADFLTSHAVDPLHQAEFTRLFDKVCDLHPTQQFIYVFEHIHLSGLLHRLDTSAMAQSIEAREPFVDYRLIEYISSLPLKYKLRWRSTADKEEASVLNSDQVSEVHDISKYLLREVGKKYLPQNIVERKKLGPPAPLNAWLTGEVKQKIKERLLSPHAKTRQLFNDEGLASWLEEGQHDNKYGLRIWMLWNLELWMQEYAVQV